MAGHFPLNKKEEPKLFKLVEDLRVQLLIAYFKASEFGKKPVAKKYEIMHLPKDYADASNEIVLAFGPVSLESITDEHPSLTQGIKVQVHFQKVAGEEIALKTIYWVA
jgi:hypothetical protein